MTFERFEAEPPLASYVGPFATPDFLETIWAETARPGDELSILSDGDGAVALVSGSDGLGLVGPENLVDYRSPVGDVRPALTEAFSKLASGVPYRFDSLPEEVADVFAESLAAAGIAPEVSQHESAAVLELPATYDDFLDNIGKKERHETKRKLRRFEESRGVPRIVTYDRPGPILLRFFRLHRLAEHEKSGFMTPRMRRLFEALLSTDGWQLDALYGDGPRCVALAMSFVDENGYYMYNSAFDPTARESSPGVVLLTTLIQGQIQALGAGKKRAVFDFLKGDEQYKYRMGAEARPLYAVEGVT